MQVNVIFNDCVFNDQSTTTVEQVVKKTTELNHKTRVIWLRLITALITDCGLDVNQKGLLDALLRLEAFSNEKGELIMSRSALANILRQLRELE